jgi:3-oxoacyl-[acyl-carrier-protein] synthase-3
LSQAVWNENRISAGIGTIGTYVPDVRIDMEEAEPRHDVDKRFLREKTGFLRLARAAEDERDSSALAFRAIQSLTTVDPDAVARCRLLVVVTQNPDGYGLPHASALLAAKIGLPPSTAAFDIGLGCSGWLYGVATALAFMEMQDIPDGLLVTSDPYSRIIDDTDRATALLFGDAATATVLTRRNPMWRLGRCVFGTDGTQAAALQVNDSRKLRMNGRAVFNFSATRVPPALEEVMQLNGLAWDDVDRIILHQGSRYIVETIARRLGQESKTPFLAAEYGNAVSSSVPLALTSGVRPGDRCVLVAGFGVGLSWAASALFRNGAT